MNQRPSDHNKSIKLKGAWLPVRFSEVCKSVLGAQLVFAIRNPEVFALGGHPPYIFYGSCSGAFSEFAGERLFALRRVRF